MVALEASSLTYVLYTFVSPEGDLVSSLVAFVGGSFIGVVSELVWKGYRHGLSTIQDLKTVFDFTEFPCH